MATPSSSSILVHETRPQAGPLPTKRGEIGYSQGVHRECSSGQESTDSHSVEPLPVRHPADTSRPSSPPAPPTPTLIPQTSARSWSLFTLFKRKNKSLGRSNITLFLIAQCSLLLITDALWVVVAKATPDSSEMKVFIHSTFGIVVLGQLVFLERTFYKFRAERYALSHPGEMMPGSLLHPRSANARLPLTPWNRPSLPTYAAVLYETGVATGDVEDVEIAIPPPPAYGITRGSTLLGTGFINYELREQSRRARVQRGESLSDLSHGSDSRPASYMSQNEDWEARCDATRARILEEALARLEDGRGVDGVVRS